MYRRTSDGMSAHADMMAAFLSRRERAQIFLWNLVGFAGITIALIGLYYFTQAGGLLFLLLKGAGLLLLLAGIAGQGVILLTRVLDLLAK